MKFSFDEKSRTFSTEIFSSQLSLVADKKILASKTADRAIFKANENGGGYLKLGFDNPMVDWDIEFDVGATFMTPAAGSINRTPTYNEVASLAGSTLIISSRITNRSGSDVKLGQCCLVDCEGGVVLGADKEKTVFLDSKADTSLSLVRRIVDIKNSCTTRIICHFYNPYNKLALFCGFITFDRIEAEHEFSYTEGKGISGLKSYCHFQGYALKPGEMVASEKLMIQESADPYSPLENWADVVHGIYKPRIWKDAPVGWIGWTWVDGSNAERYQNVVFRNARAIQKKLPGFGIKYIWVSIGNIKDGLPGNWLKFDHNNFSGTIKGLSESLAKSGIKLGFWIAPFWICAYLKKEIEAMRDCILKKTDGSFVVATEWRYGLAAKMAKDKRPAIYTLDPSHPKTLKFLREVFTAYRKWGVRYYMIDFLASAVGRSYGKNFDYDIYHDTSLIKGPQVYRNGLKVVRKAAGPDTYLLSSSGPTFLNIGIADGARVGNDYGEGRSINPDTYFYPATFVINNSDFWTSHKWATTNMASSYFTHRKFYLNDSGNVLSVDKPISLNDARISATVFGINGGPMMLGDDIDRISEERIALIKKCLPRTDECAFPVDLFDSPYPDYPKIFHNKIKTSWGEWDIVTIFNYDNNVLVKDIDLCRLGLNADAGYVLWEFWNEKYMGTVKESLHAIVPPNSVKVYRLQVKKPHPRLLGTDMHILQGLVEIINCNWNEKKMILTVKTTRPRGETGNIFIYAPKGYRVINFPECYIAKDGNDESLIIRKSLKFDKKYETFKIKFVRY